MAKILTDSWQIAENLTDYWHLPLVLLSTDKGPDCPLFSPNPVFKALNSIVPLFSSANVIKCALLGVILVARRLTLKNAKCVKFNISLPPPSGSKKALNESLVFDWRGEIWVARVSGGGNWKGMGIRNRVRTFEACTSWNGLYFEKSLKCNALARFYRLKGETLFSHQQLLWMRHIFTILHVSITLQVEENQLAGKKYRVLFISKLNLTGSWNNASFLINQVKSTL